MRKHGKEGFGLKKADWALLGALLVGAVVLLLVQRLGQRPGELVVVRVNGEEWGSYSLLEQRRELIKSGNGGTNLLVIEGGRAWVEEASCPDGLCIHQGSVKRSGESIICLPNEVVVEVVGSEEPESVDVVVK